MGSGRSIKIKIVKVDRLSNLPDDLIHKILSFIGIKQVVETSELSSTWRYMWTSMPYLNFSTDDFPSLPKFFKFVTNVLSRYNNSVNLSFRGKVSQVFVKRILICAFSHNAQQVNVTYMIKNNIEFPLSLFSSQSLKNLSFKKVYCGSYRRHWEYDSITFTSTWEIPALTMLHLDQITFSNDNADKFSGLISKCTNLKNLSLCRCQIVGSNDFNIFHSQISNLTIEYVDPDLNSVRMVAPKLKNLSIRGFSRDIHISAPDLAYLLITGDACLNFSGDDFRSLEKVDICINELEKEDAHEVVGILQHLQRVKFLTLNLEIVELLSSSVEAISNLPSPFANLKSLKIYAKQMHAWKREIMSTEVKTYLLDSSPGATSTMITREEIIAQHIMAKLRVLLKQEKASTETIRLIWRKEIHNQRRKCNCKSREAWHRLRVIGKI